MQNYNRMMDLQSQAPSFAQNDPRLNELKDERRTYNRFDKYKIGERQGVAPLDVQQQFSNQSNMLRNSAPNAYSTMYPLTNLAMKYGESGGFLGMLAKEAFGNPNIKNPATGEPFKSYGEAYTYYSMGMSDPAKRSILGRIAVSQQNQLSNYGNNEVAAKTHAIANVVINPNITDQGKNYTGKRIKKDKKGNYKPQRTPGVYIDIERKMMVEAMPDGSIVDLPEYSQYFTQFQ